MNASRNLHAWCVLGSTGGPLSINERTQGQKDKGPMEEVIVIAAVILFVIVTMCKAASDADDIMDTWRTEDDNDSGVA